MFALERRKKIMEILDLSGSVSVNDLSRELNVTVETIRRDLEKLEKLEQVTRTHGGAVLFNENVLDLSSDKRTGLNVEGKIEIAKKAIAYIQSGDSIFLDSSSTTFYLAKLLKEFRNITVITNSLQIINELSGCDSIKLIATGGVMYDKNKSFIGEIAGANIKNGLCADKVFFSSKGVTKDKGVLESNEFEHQIKKAMLANSTKKYFLVDKSKIDVIGFIKLADFTDIDIFITDGDLDNEWKKILKLNKVDII